ncbi:hypothetical protein M4I33_15835 [Clostridium sp. LY3-2]|uniref:hypothetical protein n=1 Tax=Clostridium sp. LY3-2 TaxID=2942482 RepID=UPI0021520D3E|nr:hypothetical protein [Clostridium sp. LY3-2]MCR6516334.1 hypothetical protein [Clostridium sp. LY3-2]
MIYYISIEPNTNRVLGYSSSKNNETDIEIEDSLLDEKFLRCPFFYVYNLETKKLIYKDELYQERKNQKENYKNPNEVLVDELVKTKMALMAQQDINKNILEEASKSKIAVIQQQEINKNLITEIANLKVISMKGSN